MPRKSPKPEQLKIDEESPLSEPRKARTKPPSKVRDFKGFVRCELNKSEVPDLQEWINAHNKEWQLDSFLSLVDDGYKVSVDYNQGGFRAQLYDVEASDNHCGYVLSAYANSVDGAVWCLLYKHLVKLEADWGNSDGGEGGWR